MRCLYPPENSCDRRQHDRYTGCRAGASRPVVMASFHISLRARAQLIDIYNFTEAKFGAYQAEAYHAGPEHTFSLLADFPRIGQPVDELATGYRPLSVARHLLHGRSRSYPDPRHHSQRARDTIAAVRLGIYDHPSPRRLRRATPVLNSSAIRFPPPPRAGFAYRRRGDGPEFPPRALARRGGHPSSLRFRRRSPA
jgi:toxin ParE1/3/4